MSTYLDEHATTPIPANPAAPGSFSPAELADVLAVSGSSDVRAAFAAGLSSALIPVLAIATLNMDPAASLQRLAYPASLVLLSLALLLAVTTFLETVALGLADGLAWLRGRTAVPLRDAIARGARGTLRGREVRRMAQDNGRPGAADHLLERLARERVALPPPPPRVRRAATKATASHCAATLAVLGAAVAAAAWVGA